MSALKITKDNFEAEVLQSTQPVLIDFWAEWCGPCKMQLPIVEALASEVDFAKICKVDVEVEKELARQFTVMSIPTLIVVKDGKVAKRAVGVQSKEQLLEMLK